MKTLRRLFLCLMTFVMGVSLFAQTVPFETAAEAVKNMKVGWNLGNTLESNSGDTLNMWIEHWTNRTPTDYETAWGQPAATAELVKMMKEAGFNAIRVPVTWYPHMEAKFNFSTWENSIWLASNDEIGTQVDPTWMKRVHEVVDYVVSQGMYCILNVHHDTGASNTAWLVADETVFSQQQIRFETLWRQIAEEFRDYGPLLLFEGYNEMLDTEDSWCFASYATPARYNATIANSAYNAINSYAQSFVNTVRATGGNNSQRNLVVCTYGACDGRGSWNSHLQDPLKQMKRPADTIDGHIAFEVHSYPDLTNLNNAKNEAAQMIKALNDNLAAKGAPVIVGEWGAGNENAYANYRSNMLAFARYFVELAKASNIATFYWMGLSDGDSRTVPQFNQPDLKDAIIQGYYGQQGYVNSLQQPESSPSTMRTSDPSAVYDLMGRKMSVSTTSGPRSSLRPGIYVVNGRKLLVR